MSSEGPFPSAPRRTRISREGDGYALTAPRLYVWGESLDETCAWGAELGVLPGHRAWRRGPVSPDRGRDPHHAPADPRAGHRR